jgi:hypothetical protein
VLCALVKDRTALAELEELRDVVDELHEAIGGGASAEVIEEADRFTRR